MSEKRYSDKKRLSQEVPVDKMRKRRSVMWKDLSAKQKEEYKKMILAFASLTEMFAQKAEDNDNILKPILNSKYQETVFQMVFHAKAEDIGNTSYDASLTYEKDGEKKHYLIGIKTFVFDNKNQKIAQFKANHDAWAGLIHQIEQNAIKENGEFFSRKEINQKNHNLYLKLAQNIAELRNLRIESSEANIRGFDIDKAEDKVDRVYHVLMPGIKDNEPVIYVGEKEYSPISLDTIKIKGCRKAQNPTNFTFEDGNHRYRFTSADSQLYMDFENEKIIQDTWKVIYAKNAYEIFSNIAQNISEENKPKIIESHSWSMLDKNGEVERYSGYNSFYSVGMKTGKEYRKSMFKVFVQDYEEVTEKELFTKIKENLHHFLFSRFPTGEEKREKEQLRNQILEDAKTTGNILLIWNIERMVFRSKNEVYIPIPNSSEFHRQHPAFFGEGIIEIDEETKKVSHNKKTFPLVFEPSGNEIECYITQDNGKSIHSANKQSILGEWLLRQVFQLKEHEPLTVQRLNELGINGIRLGKDTEGKIHLHFIWIEKDNLPSDYWE